MPILVKTFAQDSEEYSHPGVVSDCTKEQVESTISPSPRQKRFRLVIADRQKVAVLVLFFKTLNLFLYI